MQDLELMDEKSAFLKRDAHALQLNIKSLLLLTMATKNIIKGRRVCNQPGGCSKKPKPAASPKVRLGEA